VLRLHLGRLVPESGRAPDSGKENL